MTYTDAATMIVNMRTVVERYYGGKEEFDEAVALACYALGYMAQKEGEPNETAE